MIPMSSFQELEAIQYQRKYSKAAWERRQETGNAPLDDEVAAREAYSTQRLFCEEAVCASPNMAVILEADV